MKRKTLEALIDSLNNTIDGYEKKIREYSEFVDPFYVQQQAVIINNYRVSMYDYDVGLSSKKELAKEVERNAEQSSRSFQRIIVRLDDLKNKVDSHKDEFMNFMDHFTGGFISLRSICNNITTFMFVKGVVQKECSFDLYGIDARYNEPIQFTISPLSHIVSRMTRYEYEEYYYPSRIEHCGISNEVELDKYAIELTEMFEKYLKIQ